MKSNKYAHDLACKHHVSTENPAPSTLFNSKQTLRPVSGFLLGKLNQSPANFHKQSNLKLPLLKPDSNYVGGVHGQK